MNVLLVFGDIDNFLMVLCVHTCTHLRDRGPRKVVLHLMTTMTIELCDRSIACAHDDCSLFKQSLQHALHCDGRKGISDLQ